MRAFAFIWLGIVVMASCYLGERIHSGVHFGTDLMALLPHEEQDQVTKKASDIATNTLSRRVVFLVGDQDRTAARTVASDMTRTLAASSLFDMTTDNFDKDQLKQLGTLYYPYRAGLLSDKDRATLTANDGQTVAARALSQVYGIAGFANAKLLHGDPFLLLPSFLTSLPVPQSRLSLDDGMLSLQDNDTTWIMVAGSVRGEPFSIDTQNKVGAVYDRIVHAAQATHPDLHILHLGAVFYAQAGATQAMEETSAIGIVSTLGTILLITLIFRAVRPLLLCLTVIAVGVLIALAVSLCIFGELHAGALLFGISLIGVSVDYSLQYCTEVFAPSPSTPQQKLKRVFGGITLGTATTVIGYLTLYLAPFPGLHQIATFSAAGLVASWLTVVLWLPLLDNKKPKPQKSPLTAAIKVFTDFWGKHDLARHRMIGVAACILIAGVGLYNMHVDDDVRHMQSLAGPLVSEQQQIQKLIGTTAGNQFLVVQAGDDETALQREESVADKFAALVSAGALVGFQSPAQYIPSVKRQMDNRILQDDQLYTPRLKQQTHDLHLTETPSMPDALGETLTLTKVKKLERPPAFISTLLLSDKDGVTHMIALDNVSDITVVKKAAESIEGVRLIDPAGDFSRLLGKYRSRAIMLLALSALLMAPLLILRYGIAKGLWVMAPPLLAVITTVGLRGIFGATFTFFDAMGLVLVLSIGVDYAVFCAETTPARKNTTILAVTMAAGTALLSFGLLALSHVEAVHNFGATMTLGILFSFLFAPMAHKSGKDFGRLNLRNLFAVILLFTLNACATAQDAIRVDDIKPVPVAPNVALTLPKPGDLGRSLEAQQLVTANYGDQSFAFEARISATPQLFRLAALDMVGRKLITIDWSADHISYVKAPGVPDELRAENILADIVMLYWPDKVLRTALSGATVTTHKNTRTIRIDGTAVWQATYPNTTKDKWVGQLSYRNLAWGYHFDVQSAVMPNVIKP